MQRVHTAGNTERQICRTWGPAQLVDRGWRYERVQVVSGRSMTQVSSIPLSPGERSRSHRLREWRV